MTSSSRVKSSVKIRSPKPFSSPGSECTFSRRTEVGQSTVEFALVLPLAVLLLTGALFALVEVRDRVLVVHAARAAARVAASSDDRGAIEDAGRRAAPQLAGERLTFEVRGERKVGSLVGVVARYERNRSSGFTSLFGLGREISALVMLPAEVAD